ncbi:MAG: zinc ABC transporter substrate-binding protein [Planctomycetota bacterium]|nr:zinc ABC transporter substrate-binding protein [Planctomycetota bacterium]
MPRLTSTLRPFAWALAAPLSLLLWSCGAGEVEAGEHVRPRVVCTTAMVGDLVREIAGEEADVTVLFGADVDPHLFRPTRDDVAAITAASVVFHSGYGLEAYLEPTLAKIADGGTTVVALAPNIADETELSSETEGVVDPHLWMDVKLWARCCDVIASTLPVNGARERADALRSELLALDAEVEAVVATIPQRSRVLITAHDAFAYFGRRYGVEVHAVQGVSTASEAGLRAIEELVDLIVEREAPAVFFESTVSERNVRALVEGAGSRGHTVAIGGVLHSDAPGEARTYAAMIRHNARTIADALGGDAASVTEPEGPAQ